MARVYASEPFTRRSLREGFVAGTCARNGFFLYSYSTMYESTKVRKYRISTTRALQYTIFVCHNNGLFYLHTVRVVRVQYVYLTSYESMKH